MTTAIITGITGQDGAYLAKLLLEKGYRVIGAYRRSSRSLLERLIALGIDQRIEIVEIDLAEVNSINRIVRQFQADEFYNLAAQSFVSYSWDQPFYTTQINAMGVLHILDAIRTYSPHTRFYQASTSEMFGEASNSALSETEPFHPRSPYGVAKVYGHYITINYRESFGLHASSGILFNHESPLRGEEFVTRKITLGLAALAHGSLAPLMLGNLDASRDWGFAGEYVAGMWQMLQQENADDYVLATGTAVSVRQFVSYAAAELGMDIEWSGTGVDEVGTDQNTGKVLVKINPKFFRPADVNHLLGDAGKARRQLGWVPKVGVQELATMMARYDFEAPRRRGA